MTALSHIRSEFDLLRRGLMQHSYRRRFPGTDAELALTKLKAAVDQLIATNSIDAAAWRLHAEICECLLHYPDAISSLQEAIRLSTRERADVKKLAQLTEAAAWWNQLGLTPRELASLADFLRQYEDRLEPTSVGLTVAWAQDHGKDPNHLLQRLSALGGFSDWHILANIVE